MVDVADLDPVFLYYDPHPVHRKMVDAIDAEYVQCRTGGVVGRVAGALSHDIGERPVILEGGVPLLEGAVARLARRARSVIALGADSTYHDLVEPLPYRTRAERVAHRVSLRFVDGTIAVSDDIAAIARRITGGPARVAHPFIHEERFEKLGTLEPDYGSTEVLCLGKLRPKNGQRLLLDALDRVDADVTVHFVGPDTDELGAGDRYVGHGFVDEDELLERFAGSALMVFPARSGAFPVATLEAMRAGLPVVLTSVCGTAAVYRGVSGRLVADPDPASVTTAMNWYFSLPVERRRELGERSRRVGSQFDEATGLDTFVTQFERLMEDL
jgi:glycosyltransferase involved in cell wall biosynthesis